MGEEKTDFSLLGLATKFELLAENWQQIILKFLSKKNL